MTRFQYSATFRTRSAATSSRQIDANDTVSPRGLLFRRPGKAIEFFGDSDVGKTRVLEHRDQLCVQQSTGDSTGPEVNVFPCVLGQFHAHHDVRDLQAAPRLQDAPNFGDRRCLFSDEIQNAV